MDAQARKQAIKAFRQALQAHEEPLDPADPADKPLYVESLHLLKTDGVTLDPVVHLADEIDAADGTRVWLFTGNIGCGKSTELRRLRQKLKAQGHSCLLIDARDYININQPIQIGDFLVSLVAGIAEAAGRELNDQGLLDRTYWERFWSYLTKTRINVEEFNVGDDKASLKLALKQDPEIKERLQRALAGHVATLQRELEAFLADTVFPRLREGNAGRKIVLLVDSLERLRGDKDGAKVFSSVLDMFGDYAEMLRIKDAQVVYSVAPYMLKLRPHLAAQYGNAAVVHLTSLHIFENRSETLDTEGGVKNAVEIVRRRYPDYVALLSDDVMQQVIEYSGGDLRDLFRLLNLLLSVLDKADNEAAAFNYAKEQMRRDMTWITGEELARLRKVAQTKNATLETAAEREAFVQDLELKRVLMYRNGEDWCDVHPLLRDLIESAPDDGARATG